MGAVDGHEFVVDRGEGCYIWDEAGTRYLDATASLWYANVGYGRTEIARAAAAQLEKLHAYHVFGDFATRPVLDVSDRLAAIAPVADSKGFLTSGGSDAVDTAAKLARRYWQHRGGLDKTIILSRERSYHGLHAFGTSLAGLPFNRDGYGRDSLVPETARVPVNDADALAATIEALGADRVAAFFAEPVVGTGGVIPPAPGYLERAQEICRANDVLFVVDEVITGFGRTGAMFASLRYGLEPDLVLMAKGITSGYLPLGGVLVAPRVWSPFFEEDGPSFRHGVTYSGHATACAVAQVNLDIIEEESLVDRVRDLESVLADVLTPLVEQPGVEAVRAGVGLLAGIQLSESVPSDVVLRSCREQGVLLRMIAEHTLQVSPPFIVTPAEVEEIAAAVTCAVQSVPTAGVNAD
jgi:adenosylmethionine-8-amino-7-oxononanoate aminotransferase